MIKQTVYNLEGKKLEEMELKPEVFENEINHDLLYQTVIALGSNKRRPTAHTKDRSEVRGGGRKPWKQKGTGNARAGSIRSPIFRGGGVTFGPTNEKNYYRKINKKVRRIAFLMTLSGKLKDDELVIIDNFELKRPNTKKLSVLIDKFKANNKSILILTKDKNDNLKNSVNNLERVKTRMVGGVSVLDLLNSKYLYLDKQAVIFLNESYGKKASKIKADKVDIKKSAKSNSK